MIFDLILKGQNEFCKKINNKIYYILKVIDENKEKYMNKIITNFINNKSYTKFIGLDFEFNLSKNKKYREIALMQINLENDDEYAYIFIIYPPDLNNNKILLNLLTCKNIIKILHGGESLDIPFLFDKLLITKDNINNFCNNLYDTKYICDYHNIINNINNKCSIYYLLVNHNIITNDKLLELESIEIRTGPMYLIHTDIYSLNINILRYALYDVIYLPQLLKYFLKNEIYIYIIPNLTSLIYKYKKDIYFDHIKLEDYINNLNNYYFYKNNKKITLNNFWKIFNNISDDNNIINNIKKINYFKKFINILTKYILYYNIHNYNIIIYNNNNKIYKIDNINYLIKFIKKHHFFYKIIKQYNNNVKNELKKYFIK
jgi:hypothetical protein